MGKLLLRNGLSVAICRLAQPCSSALGEAVRSNKALYKGRIAVNSFQQIDSDDVLKLVLVLLVCLKLVPFC